MEGDFIWPLVLHPRANMTSAWDSRAGSASRFLHSGGVRYAVLVFSPHPSGWAEERRSKRIRARDSLRRSRVRARPRFYRAPQVARSEAKGPRPSGRLSFGYFSLATQRKVPRPPGRDPACRHTPTARAIHHGSRIKSGMTSEKLGAPLPQPVRLGRGAQPKTDQGSRLSERSEFERDPVFGEHRRLPGAKRKDPDCRIAFSLVTFFWRSKRKLLAAGQPPASWRTRQQEQSEQSAKMDPGSSPG